MRTSILSHIILAVSSIALIASARNANAPEPNAPQTTEPSAPTEYYEFRAYSITTGEDIVSITKHPIELGGYYSAKTLGIHGTDSMYIKMLTSLYK